MTKLVTEHEKIVAILIIGKASGAQRPMVCQILCVLVCRLYYNRIWFGKEVMALAYCTFIVNIKTATRTAIAPSNVLLMLPKAPGSPHC